MKQRFGRSRRRAAAALIGCAAGIGLPVAFPEACATGVSRGLAVCGKIIIPSLLPFLVLAGFLTQSGLAEKLGAFLDRPMRLLFGLSGCCGAAVVIGFLGGYPAGASTVAALFSKGAIGREDAAHLLRFCVMGGPAFVICAVGAGMMHSVSAGLLLYCAQVAAALLIGLCGRRSKAPAVKQTRRDGLPYGVALVHAVADGSGAMLSVCGFVTLSAVVMSLLDASNAMRVLTQIVGAPFVMLGFSDTPVQALLAGSLEVTNGCLEAVTAERVAPLLLGFLLGFGGVSVMGQLASILMPHGLFEKGIFRARLVFGVLGGLISQLLFLWIPVPWSATSAVVMMDTAVRSVTEDVAGGVLGAASLLVTVALFLFTLPKRGGRFW